ncbi:MAG: hypothetical protein C5B50_14235 [Verrucomicrobia bacterium]|nr:MAG: hypothetical protein C5B50_14235 [Verrucomicrobiota bacterium]
MRTVRKIALAIALFIIGAALTARGAGVTIITHGLNGDADGWVSGMAAQIPNYPAFPGTNYTFYKIYFVPTGTGSYRLAWGRLGGSQPLSTDSGQIVVALDWGQLADGNSYSTYQVAAPVASALQDTSFISELNGHALCELPLHLIGHSRGGSLMAETSRYLGTNGVWVDHLTTLDPHPLNNDGFDLDGLLYSVTDAPVRYTTCLSVLYRDNYWQDDATFVYGEPVWGAFNRQLSGIQLSGGYQDDHSNVHLWYHGTVDRQNPASDGEAQITSAELANWYTAYEAHGANAGFKWSLIGGGDRMSYDAPAGGWLIIRDGYNQVWDLGAGTQFNNRATLPRNNGNWPNVIKFNLIGSNPVPQTTNIFVKYFYQWAASSVSNGNASVGFYLDDDLNPFNDNARLLTQISVPANGSNYVSSQTVSLALDSENASAGQHSLYAKITAGGRSRYLYAPEILTVLPPSDTVKPIVKISEPTVGARVTGPVLSMQGTASDNVDVVRVEYRIENANGTGQYEQLPATPAGPGTVNWFTSLPSSGLAAGTNTLRVRAFDSSGNIGEVSVSFTYVVQSQLTVSISGHGSVTPDLNGQFLQVGKSYTLTAKPAADSIFVNWTVGFVSGSSAIKFVMQQDLALQANFIPNPFILLKGSYSGIFYNPTNLTSDKAGSFMATVSGKGVCSARTVVGGKSFTMRGAFDPTGFMTNAVPRPGLSPLFFQLSLDLSGGDQITGQVTDGAWISALTAYRAGFSASRNPWPQPSKYTLAIPGSEDADLGPSGFGGASLAVDANGGVKVSGALADNSKFTSSGFLSKDAIFPIFAALYQGKGVLIGWAATTNTPASDLTADMLWVKAADPASALYPAGFGFEAACIGSKYTPAVAPASALTFTNGVALLQHGGLPTIFTNQFMIIAGNKVLNVGTNKMALSVSTSTGLFSGTVSDPSTGTPLPCSGVLLQNVSAGYGFFLRDGQSGSIYLGPPGP